MYCKNCGKEIGDSRFCPYCGAERIDEFVPAQPVAQKETNTFWWGVLGYFFPIVGLILFIVWRTERPKASESAGIGALASVITGGVGGVIAVVVAISVFGVALGFAASDVVGALALTLFL